jgi:hypothetical protein
MSLHEAEMEGRVDELDAEVERLEREVERLREVAGKALTDEDIDQITRDRWGTQLLGVMVQAHREYARAILRAALKETK